MITTILGAITLRDVLFFVGGLASTKVLPWLWVRFQAIANKIIAKNPTSLDAQTLAAIEAAVAKAINKA